MKTITIKNVQGWDVVTKENSLLKDFTLVGPEEMDASDGYHNFEELYDHRITLFIALCRMIEQMGEGDLERNHVWRSKEHQVGGSPMYSGWFVMGINKGEGVQISYHLPLDRWDETEFAYTMDHAPDWDGHTPADVITRLKQLV